MSNAGREALHLPHRSEHVASVAMSMQRAVPKGFNGLRHWFLTEWAVETPMSIHIDDVWRDWVRLDENRSAEGGSLLGALKYRDDFRAYIEGSPHATDADGRYERPLRAAVASLCGRSGHSGPTDKLQPAPFMARFLFRYGTSSGALLEVAASMGIPPQVAEIYAERAIQRVHRLYAVGPDLLNEQVA